MNRINNMNAEKCKQKLPTLTNQELYQLLNLVKSEVSNRQTLKKKKGTVVNNIDDVDLDIGEFYEWEQEF